MAEEGETPAIPTDDVDEDTPGYKAPAQKSLDEILKQDTDDKSLENYKKVLLGADATQLSEFDSTGLNVMPTKLGLAVEGRPDLEISLEGDLKDLKKKPLVLKEGIQYKIKIHFHVKREIVAGLKYTQKSYRKGIRVDSANYMVGSYGPKKDAHIFTSHVEDVPSGMMARGVYNIHSRFTDDDKNIYLEWDWAFEIKKDWD